MVVVSLQQNTRTAKQDAQSKHVMFCLSALYVFHMYELQVPVRHREFQPRGSFELQELIQTDLKSKESLLFSIRHRPGIRKQHEMTGFPACFYHTKRKHIKARPWDHETMGMGRQKLLLVTSCDYCFNLSSMGEHGSIEIISSSLILLIAESWCGDFVWVMCFCLMFCVFFWTWCALSKTLWPWSDGPFKGMMCGRLPETS